MEESSLKSKEETPFEPNESETENFLTEKEVSDIIEKAMKKQGGN